MRAVFKLLEVNGIKLNGLSHQEAVNTLRSLQGQVQLKVVRLPPDTNSVEVRTLLRQQHEQRG